MGIGFLCIFFFFFFSVFPHCVFFSGEYVICKLCFDDQDHGEKGKSCSRPPARGNEDHREGSGCGLVGLSLPISWAFSRGASHHELVSRRDEKPVAMAATGEDQRLIALV